MEDFHLTEKLAALARDQLHLATSNRDVERDLALQLIVRQRLEAEAEKAKLLLVKSRRLQRYLQKCARRNLTATEKRRKDMSLRLQDKIVQTLEGIHLRLLVLDREVSVSDGTFQKEIATTQKLVRNCAEVIKGFQREHDVKDEA